MTIGFQAHDGYLRIAVCDTGTGIETEQMGRLFDPFDRLDADLRGIEGTGLGLTISRSLAEAMGGSLSVASKVGYGSTFWLDLPVPPERRRPRLSEPADLTEVLAPSGGVSSRHAVLYVEDNAANQVLVQRILEWRPSVELVIAADGRTALALAREQHPCLILLDLHLPGASVAGDPRCAATRPPHDQRAGGDPERGCECRPDPALARTLENHAY